MTAYSLAMLVMVGFALIPWRLWFVKLPAVLGWVAVWLDGAWTAHWFDSVGLAVTAASLLFLLFLDQPPTTSRNRDGGAAHRPRDR